MKKKILAILLCSIMILSMVACGKEPVVGTPSITTLADFSDLSKVFTGNYEVKESDVLEGFSSFLSSVGINGEWVEVKDRDVVTKDDIVKLDYTGYLDDKAFEGGSAKDQYINVGKNASVNAKTGAVESGFIDNFTDGLVNAKVGDTVKHKVTFPTSYGAANLAGKETTFEFKIHGIYTFKAVTPETVTDAQIKEKLEKDHQITTVQGVLDYVEEVLAYNNLSDYIFNNSKFDIPEDYLEYRVDKFIEYQNESFKAQYGDSVTLESYLAMSGYTLETVRPQWKATIKQQIQSELVFEEMVKVHKLTADEKEFEKFMTENLGDKDTAETRTEFYKGLSGGFEELGEAYAKNALVVDDYLNEIVQKHLNKADEGTEGTTESTTEETTEGATETTTK